jgi:hypothetical protein
MVVDTKAAIVCTSIYNLIGFAKLPLLFRFWRLKPFSSPQRSGCQACQASPVHPSFADLQKVLDLFCAVGGPRITVGGAIRAILPLDDGWELDVEGSPELGRNNMRR